MSGRTWSTLAIASVSALVITGCGGTGSFDSATKGGKEATIGVVVPMSGVDSSRGLGVFHAVELAAKQANESGEIPGWTLKVVAKDDESESSKSEAAAKDFAADSSVVGVVGSIYSGLTRGAAGPLSQAGIVQVSPTASNPALTKGDNYATQPARQFSSFFRVCPPDDFYGPSLGAFLNEKGLKRVATVHDNSEYGIGLVQAFSAAFTSKGGQVTTSQVLNVEKGNYAEVVKPVVDSKPQAVFFGGLDVDGAPLSRHLKAAGLIVPFVGGDGLYTPDYLTMSGALSAGDISALGGAPAADSDNGRKFLADYRQQRFDAPVSPETPLGYDAARAIIEALKKSLPSASSPADARKATVEAMSSVSFTGVAGSVAFDNFGDNRNKTLTFYVVDGGNWVTAKTVTS